MADQIKFDADVLKQHAARFNPERFRRDLRNWAEHKWRRFVLAGQEQVNRE